MLRRSFLRQSGVLCALSGGALLGYRGSAQAFGVSPNNALDRLLPAAARAESVLEIFLCGGVSQYESFYCVPEHGRSDLSHYHLFENTETMAAVRAACQLTGDATQPFATDALGQLVHFGPFAMPLRSRPDVMSRTRVAILRHDLAPHEAAIPLALSGRSLGNPALAGLGSHVQRYFSEANGVSQGPVAYALTSSSLGAVPIDNLRALSSAGLHPASARPLSVRVDAGSDLAAQLGRPAVTPYRDAYDALQALYAGKYSDKLRWQGNGAQVRARRHEDFLAGSYSLEDTDNIRTVLDPSAWNLRAAENCGASTELDATGAQLRLAARLLTHPTRPAKYVCVVDGGFIPLTNGGGGYDSHNDNTLIQSRNLTYVLQRLLDLVRTPGETAAEKIDLSRTLIILNTEFGRSPFAEGANGRSHWPYGYPIVYLGGPIATAGIFGACDATAYGVSYSPPQITRIAALLALGIWPFAAEGFNVSDVPGARSEEEAAALALAHLGLA